MKRTLASLTLVLMLAAVGTALAQSSNPNDPNNPSNQSSPSSGQYQGTDPSTQPSSPNATTPSQNTNPNNMNNTNPNGTDQTNTGTGTMPRTASPLPLVGLVGVAALAGGFVLSLRRREA